MRELLQSLLSSLDLESNAVASATDVTERSDLPGPTHTHTHTHTYTYICICICNSATRTLKVPRPPLEGCQGVRGNKLI